MAIKRLFFGMEATVPPLSFPASGRTIPLSSLHTTLVFLGNIEASPLETILDTCPFFSSKIGIAAQCDELLFLPKEHPRVVAFHVKEPSFDSPLSLYQKQLFAWLENHHIPVKASSFLPHITMARSPFDKKQWETFFSPFPIFLTHLHLYQSMGNLTYLPIWSRPLLSPFEEIEHTADIAFKIRGDTLQQIHLHAFTALAWKSPSLLLYFSSFEGSTLDDVIIDLNKKLSLSDIEGGSPFKAISFHGDLCKTEQGILEWEMIVDV